MFSDLNNLEVVTTTTEKYETAFGFTEGEVFAAMDEAGLCDREGVRRWYDGFVFGRTAGIYNPWSVTQYLDKGRLGPYWADTGGTGPVSGCVARGGAVLGFRTCSKGRPWGKPRPTPRRRPAPAATPPASSPGTCLPTASAPTA